MIHNKSVHGAMKLKIIITDIEENNSVKKHEEKVNEFNRDNTVWFNQTTEMKDNFLYSSILYT